MFIDILGAVKVKKFLITAGLVIGVFLSSNVVAYSQGDNTSKINVVTEIGTLANSKKYDEALEKCNIAMQNYPNDYELYYWKGAIESNLGNHEIAVKDFDKAIELNPKLASLYVMRGISKSYLDDTEGAMNDFNQAIKLDPKDSSAYSMRACVKIALGDLKGANDDLDMANKLFDESVKTE